VEDLREVGGRDTTVLAAKGKMGSEPTVNAPWRMPTPPSRTKRSTRNGKNPTIGLRSRERFSTPLTLKPFECHFLYSIFRQKVKRGRNIAGLRALHFDVDSPRDPM